MTMFTTLQIGNRKVNPAIHGEIVYKVTFARPTKTVGRGNNRREVTIDMVIHCHASDREMAVRVGKRELFANWADEIKYGPVFQNTRLVYVQKTLNGRVLD